MKCQIDTSATYIGEEVLAMLAGLKVKDQPVSEVSTDRREEGRTEVRYKGTTRRGWLNQGSNIITKKKKFSLGTQRGDASLTEGCWICGKKGHYKDECPFVRFRFCKGLGHRIA